MVEWEHDGVSDYPSPVSLALDAPECLPGLAGAVAACGVPAPTVWAWGELGILRQPLLGLFCSVRCPSQAILRAHDLAHALRDAGIPVVAGFHSPVERECLRMLLRGSQPVVICPARGLERMRVPPGMARAAEPTAAAHSLAVRGRKPSHDRGSGGGAQPLCGGSGRCRLHHLRAARR